MFEMVAKKEPTTSIPVRSSGVFTEKSSYNQYFYIEKKSIFTNYMGVSMLIGDQRYDFFISFLFIIF